MRVILRQPRREVEVEAAKNVRRLLDRMGIVSESVLVIRGDELLTLDTPLAAEDVVELRPVISGG
jgi:sulfur carrier protein